MKNKYMWRIAIAILIILIPIGVNCLMIEPSPFDSLQPVGSYKEWIPFWGSFIGALIAGLVTVYLLRETIKENRNAISIAHKKEDLDRYIVEIANNLLIFNSGQLSRITKEMLANNDKANELLMSACDYIREHFTRFDLAFSCGVMSTTEDLYIRRINKLCFESLYHIEDLKSLNGLMGAIMPNENKNSSSDTIISGLESCIQLYKDKYANLSKESENHRLYIENHSPLPFIFEIPIIKNGNYNISNLFNETGKGVVCILSKIEQNANDTELKKLSRDLIKEKREEIESLLND